MDKEDVKLRWSQEAINAAIEAVKCGNVDDMEYPTEAAYSVLAAIEPFVLNGHRSIPSYFSAEIEQGTHSATLEACLKALKLELRDDVHREHARRVRGEISRLTGALENIAKGYPFGSKKDMSRYAGDAVGMGQKRDVLESYSLSPPEVMPPAVYFGTIHSVNKIDGEHYKVAIYVHNRSARVYFNVFDSISAELWRHALKEERLVQFRLNIEGCTNGVVDTSKTYKYNISDFSVWRNHSMG